MGSKVNTALRLLGTFGLVALAACSLPADVDAPTVAMGDFSLGHNIVVANEPTIGPFSRKASDEEWKNELTAGIARRFDRYDGERLYHLGVKIEAYALALPGVPLVFKPKSVLVLLVTAWDDEKQEKLNPEPKQITVFEGVSSETLISSGLTQNKKKQMVRLSDNAAEKIQEWLLENPQWFGLPTAEALEDPALDGEIVSETLPAVN